MEVYYVKQLRVVNTAFIMTGFRLEGKLYLLTEVYTVQFVTWTNH